LIEGFGLPVFESIARGKPCVCSARGALGEATKDGGCVGLDLLSADALESALGHLLTSPAELAHLTAEAHRRTFKTWSRYSQELTGWLESLRST
jgi:glycosyltransferase involved in cell wall biosynthesis